MPHAKFPFTFSVIADDLCRPVQEPAALPGGYVFVSAALLLAARDEAEVAGMLAHAMGHISQQHGNQQITQAMFMSVAPMPLTSTVSCGGGAGIAVPQGFMASQRRAELEADRLAVEAMADAGFDPNALLRYIRRVQPDDATLPRVRYGAPLVLPRAKRIEALEQAIGKLPERTYTPGVNLNPIQAEVRRVVPAAPLPKDSAPTLRPGGK
jgi:predicted Zn-dependent protease